MRITATTPVYAVWGWPIGHSFSPLIHNAAFAHLGIPGVYVACPVPPERLAEAVAGARALGLAGWNVTIPHKEAILPLLDEVDPTAVAIGAVNTVVRRGEERLVGYNTDARGFLEPLQERLGFEPAGRTALLLGAGGAARAVAFGLAAAGIAELRVLNRTRTRAERLAADLRRHHPELRLRVAELREPVPAEELAGVDLLVQTTPRGLGDRPPLELDWGGLPRTAIVADLTYGADVGPFLEAAVRRGHPIFDGIWMLLGQAALAFELWTGRRFAVEQAYEWIAAELRAGP